MQMAVPALTPRHGTDTENVCPSRSDEVVGCLNCCEDSHSDLFAVLRLVAAFGKVFLLMPS